MVYFNLLNGFLRYTLGGGGWILYYFVFFLDIFSSQDFISFAFRSLTCNLFTIKCTIEWRKRFTSYHTLSSILTSLLTLLNLENGAYVSYFTHPGVAVHVTPWLRFCMQVHIFHNSSVTTRCIALKLSTILFNYHTYVNNQVW